MYEASTRPVPQIHLFNVFLQFASPPIIVVFIQNAIPKLFKALLPDGRLAETNDGYELIVVP